MLLCLFFGEVSFPSFAFHVPVEPTPLGKLAVLGMCFAAAEQCGIAAVFRCASCPNVGDRCCRQENGKTDLLQQE